MDPVKYAVIGTGNMGRNHARAASELPQLALLAVADSNRTAAEYIAGLYSCPAFDDYRAMLDAHPIEAVSICVPTTKHAEIAGECLKRGIHVLLEKPIAPTVEQARALQALAAQQKRQLMIGHIERFNPAVQKVKEMLDAGQVGRVFSIIARRVGVFPPQIRDANIAVDLAIHDLDIVSYLLGEFPIEVTSDKRRNHIELREDSVEFFLRYKSASAHVQANWVTPVKIRKLHITGTEGYLEMDYMSQKIQFYKSNYEKFRDSKDHVDGYADYVLKYMEPDLMEITVDKREPLKEEMRYFIDHIRSGAPIDTDYAIRALEIALAA